MRVTSFLTGASAVVVCTLPGAPSARTPRTTSRVTATPLVLEKNQGERRIWRAYPGHPQAGPLFVLKIDSLNGGSSHLVLGTEDFAPGDSIETHKHPHADEVLLIETGTARVHVGSVVRDVHAGATVFIPAGTWISMANIGRDVVSLAFIFSDPGFERMMRAGSVREGEANLPMSKAENDAFEKHYLNEAVYK
jgi:mannose-6-phosphate isomerase-like protein (cupin superfamily)